MFDETPVRIAIVSDSEVVREGLVSLVGRLDGALVVDVVPLDQQHLEADLAIRDLGTPDGPRALAGLKQDVPVLALVHDKTRAVGTLPELAGSERLIDLSVTSDELGALIGQFARRHVREGHGPGPSVLPARLTEREFQVLTLVGQGLHNQQIADVMYISVNTVKTYIRSAYRRIQVKSRPQAILWALEHGLAARPDLHHIDRPASDVVRGGP